MPHAKILFIYHHTLNDRGIHKGRNTPYYTDRLLSQPEDSFSVPTVDHGVRDSRVTG